MQSDPSPGSSPHSEPPSPSRGEGDGASRQEARHTIQRNGAIGLVAVAAVVASLAAAPGARGVLGAGLALIMLAIAVADVRAFIIPNELNAAGFALALVYAAFARADDGVAAALAWTFGRGAALALMFFALREAYRRLRRREGLGMGDVKLAAVAGAWLDWTTMPVAVEIAALAALAVYALRHFVFGRPVQATSRIPFGLFFAPAIWFAWLIEVTLLAY